jgi:membrane protein
LWAFVVVLGTGALLLSSLVLGTVLEAVTSVLPPDRVPGGTALLQLTHQLVSVGLQTVMFAMVYRILPDTRVDWRDVWLGALVTAVLFTLGKYLIALYLGWAGVTSAYGAAGSLVLILVWVYYSSQLVLFGAEFTYVHAQRRRQAAGETHDDTPTGKHAPLPPEPTVR